MTPIPPPGPRTAAEDRYKYHTKHDDWWCECGHPYAEAEARAGLDVERLARALRTAAETTDMDDPTTVGHEKHVEWAAAIAAAYGGRDGLREALEWMLTVTEPGPPEALRWSQKQWAAHWDLLHAAREQARAALRQQREGQRG